MFFLVPCGEIEGPVVASSSTVAFQQLVGRFSISHFPEIGSEYMAHRCAINFEGDDQSS
jgi:hypothetical protein